MIVRTFFTTTFIFLLCLCSVNVMAQSEYVDDAEQILEIGIQNAEAYAQNYVEPLMVGFGLGMSDNWYNTAKPHKLLGFDLTITASFVKVPDSKKTFAVSAENGFDMSVISPAVPGDNETWTVMGSDEDGPEFNYSYTDEENNATYSGSFTGLPGAGLKENIGFERIPAPTVQLGVGLIKSTDLLVRFIPNINFGENKVSYYGFGLKHEIGQWIPVIKRVPIDISILGAFSKSDNRFGIDEEADQFAEFDVTNWTAQLLVSKKLSVLTGYMGIGYAGTSSSFKMLGDYTVTANNNEPVTYQDPLDFGFNSGNIQATIGARVKLGVFTIHGDYTIQEYNIWSAGIGFAFR